MTKTLACSVLASMLIVSGCNTAKNKVIPSDPKQWDQIGEAAKSLNETDRKSLTAYMMRMTMLAAFSGSGGIPPGTTIGDALTQQKQFEEKQQAEEVKANTLKAQVAAQRAADVAKIQQAATVAIVNMTVSPENMMAGRYSARLNLDVAVQNKTPKTITGVKGTINFKDQFGTNISEMRLSLSEDVPPGATRSFTSYGKDVNQFEASDQKLSTIPFDRMKVTFEPEMVVFSDGSNIGTPEKSE